MIIETKYQADIDVRYSARGTVELTTGEGLAAIVLTATEALELLRALAIVIPEALNVEKANEKTANTCNKCGAPRRYGVNKNGRCTDCGAKNAQWEGAR